jgi:hypothetical protein
VAFMAAQTDNNQNLIDYREFVISGKVMVIEKEAGDITKKLPIKVRSIECITKLILV